MMKVRNMIYICLLACAALASCDTGVTYSEQKNREREIIKNFLERNVVIKYKGDTLANIGKIKVITEEQFANQDSTTNVSQNEFVLFKSKGVYMQIVRKGVGTYLKRNEQRLLALRYWEYNISGDSIQLTNRISQYDKMPEYCTISNIADVLSSSLSSPVPEQSLLYSAYGDSNIPEGWLVAMPYIKIGRQISDEKVAMIRLIVPHSMGHSHASNNVYACLYELIVTER